MILLSISTILLLMCFAWAAIDLHRYRETVDRLRSVNDRLQFENSELEHQLDNYRYSTYDGSNSRYGDCE